MITVVTVGLWAAFETIVFNYLLTLVAHFLVNQGADLIQEAWLELVALLDAKKDVIVTRIDASELQLRFFHDKSEPLLGVLFIV